MTFGKNSETSSTRVNNKHTSLLFSYFLFNHFVIPCFDEKETTEGGRATGIYYRILLLKFCFYRGYHTFRAVVNVLLSSYCSIGQNYVHGCLETKSLLIFELCA